MSPPTLRVVLLLSFVGLSACLTPGANPGSTAAGPQSGGIIGVSAGGGADTTSPQGSATSDDADGTTTTDSGMDGAAAPDSNPRFRIAQQNPVSMPSGTVAPIQDVDPQLIYLLKGKRSNCSISSGETRVHINAQPYKDLILEMMAYPFNEIGYGIRVYYRNNASDPGFASLDVPFEHIPNPPNPTWDPMNSADVSFVTTDPDTIHYSLLMTMSVQPNVEVIKLFDYLAATPCLDRKMEKMEMTQRK